MGGYRRWLETQGEGPAGTGGGLAEEPVLRQRRAPGNTCLSALRGNVPGFADLPVNNSKGCGGVMRVAPVGLVAARPCGVGIASAALTHGHPSGYLAAGAGAVLIACLRDGQPLRSAVEEAVAAVSPWKGHEETVSAPSDTRSASPIGSRCRRRRRWPPSARGGWRRRRWPSRSTAR